MVLLGPSRPHNSGSRPLIDEDIISRRAQEGIVQISLKHNDQGTTAAAND